MATPAPPSLRCYAILATPLKNVWLRPCFWYIGTPWPELPPFLCHSKKTKRKPKKNPHGYYVTALPLFVPSATRKWQASMHHHPNEWHPDVLCCPINPEISQWPFVRMTVSVSTCNENVMWMCNRRPDVLPWLFQMTNTAVEHGKRQLGSTRLFLPDKTVCLEHF